MRPVSVNVDFEETLLGRPARLSLRASVEFLALWVQSRPLLASRPYSDEYLKYVSEKSGHPTAIATQGDAEEWWGDTRQQELMRRLSSKTEFRSWWQSRWPLEARNCFHWNELTETIQTGPWLIKKSDGMSGRGHLKATAAELPALRERLEKSLSQGVVVEPLYQRTRDLSALWLAEENRFIYYANMIDDRFQWRGTILESSALDSVPSGTGDWASYLRELQGFVGERGYQGPFSVDAFFYQTTDGEKFHPGSELNPRKTMGWVSYQLWRKQKAPFASLALASHPLDERAWHTVAQFPEATLLSPAGCPFTWYWIEAESSQDLEKKRRDFLTKLPAAPGRDKV